MSHSVLILGGGVMQLPAIRIARRKGWHVSVADGNPACPGASLADAFYPVDLKDAEGLIAAARAAQPRLTGIFTAGTDFSASVAHVAEALGLPGTSYESALNASDKVRMRGCFRRAGVPSPRFSELTSLDNAEDAVAALGFPVVVKPVDNMGARGVSRIDRREDLSDAVASAIRYSRSGRAIIEELIPGREYSIDAIVDRGVVTICGLAERHIFFPPAFVEMGHTIPALLDGRVERELVDVFTSGVRALGITSGAAKGDVFHTGSGAVIGEIAARLSGGYMSGWTYPYSSGVEVTEAALNLCVGLPAGDLSRRRDWVSAERAFLSVPGTVAAINGVAAARTIPGIREVFLRVERGMDVTFPANNVEKSGNVIACAPTRAEAVRAAQYALRCIEIRLEPNVDATDRFLFAGIEGPAVLTLSTEENRRVVAYLRERRPTMDRLSAALSGAIDEPVNLPEIIPLPSWEAESEPNWAGVSVADAVRTSLRRHGLVMAPRPKRPERPAITVQEDDTRADFSALFWTALIRGGVQGVDYLIDSLAARMPFGITAAPASRLDRVGV